jgi:PTH2 family peptidyl-tRNA hydrolase
MSEPAKHPRLVIMINESVEMSPGKRAAQAVHAALKAHGIEHGAVVVLNGRAKAISEMAVQIRDAGVTELEPGTLTAGAQFETRLSHRPATLPE